ncbi:MAG: pyruvate ferredoxin oxidoreductase [Nanoarchaeota archaeon]|nr:pyruvate ferredoxin oxidoreductase [Nanoarchaeota archaeon]MBU1004306.1 pyruvate ferredoxin oxidoreductase [Nanoarchaeota archaeon]MBU1945476.1 pyruvate ferredoxin oxidoreductase [Nanoarchaeota archaeon]
MSKTTAMTGAESAAEAMRQINPDVVAAYPITPQTAIAQNFANYVANGIVDTELVRVESEHSAMSCCVGASAAGARVMTATSSAGLALMWEIVGVAAGLRLPIVMEVVNRALSAPINIHCDHSDSMGTRDLGWIQIFSENAQEVYEHTLIAVRLAEKLLIPAMVCQDGFITSHGVENVEIFDDEGVKKFVGEHKYPYGLLDIKKPVTHGPLQLQDYYFETRSQQIPVMEEAKKEFVKIGEELGKITKKKYPLFDEYEMKDAEAVIVVMNSTAGTTKTAIDAMRKEGKKVGLLKLRLFRPFPYKEVSDALKHVKKIAVLDRSVSFGANPPLYSEVKNGLYDVKYTGKLHSCVFGLGGRNIFVEDIIGVFNRLLDGKLKDHDYIGLREE